MPALLCALVLGATRVKADDIVDVAAAAPNFKTLVAAVKAAGLVDTLKGEGPFTVFAPTDAAFAKLLSRPRPKLILTEHGRHYPDLVSPKRRAFNRLVLDRLADDVNACIGFSGRALRDVDGFRGGRIHVIDPAGT